MLRVVREKIKIMMTITHKLKSKHKEGYLELHMLYNVKYERHQANLPMGHFIPHSLVCKNNVSFSSELS